jgi:hypothetical protein
MSSSESSEVSARSKEAASREAMSWGFKFESLEEESKRKRGKNISGRTNDYFTVNS